MVYHEQHALDSKVSVNRNEKKANRYKKRFAFLYRCMAEYSPYFRALKTAQTLTFFVCEMRHMYASFVKGMCAFGGEKIVIRLPAKMRLCVSAPFCI